MAYPIVFAESARAVIRTLPSEVKEILTEALLRASEKPEEIPRLGGNYAPDLGVLGWDGRRGIAFIIVNDDEQYIDLRMVDWRP